MRQVQSSTARSPQKSSSSGTTAARPFAVETRSGSADVDRATRLGHGVLGPMHASAPVAQLASLPRNAGSDGTAKRPSPERNPSRTGLPDTLKTGIKRLSGISLNHVRVHYGSPRPAALNARAFARGSEIHIAPGQHRHLPHEAWHIVQQAQGRVRPTRQTSDGVPVNDHGALEHEADVMGAKAGSGSSQGAGHAAGCGCSGCGGDRQSAQAPAQNAGPGVANGVAGVAQLCQFGHPEHSAVAACPTPWLGRRGVRIPPKHVKGNPGGNANTTKASASVMTHAQQQILAGNATYAATEPNDHVLEVPRQHAHRNKGPRRFKVHRGGGDGATLDMYMEQGQSSDSESSDSDSSGSEDEKEKEEKESK